MNNHIYNKRKCLLNNRHLVKYKINMKKINNIDNSNIITGIEKILSNK
jgi:hypothetical protein